MKKLIGLAKEKLITFFRWLWSECKDWHTIALLGFVCLALGSPVWVCYLIGFIFDLEWAYVVATVVWGFWMLPGAPFVALSVSITLFIKRMWERAQRKKTKNDTNDHSDQDKNKHKQKKAD